MCGGVKVWCGLCGCEGMGVGCEGLMVLDVWG